MDGGSVLAVFGLRLPPKETMLAALHAGSQESSAWLAYALLGLCWIVLFARAQRLAGFAAAIDALSELQRVQLLKQSYPAFAAKDWSSAVFIKSRQRRAWLFALLALVAALTVVAIASARALP